MVSWLISQGADLTLVDGKDNTVLHYAAGLSCHVTSWGGLIMRRRTFSQVFSIRITCTGYGRQEVAELLINAGAKLDALNSDKQTPLDAAKVNREVRLWLC
jgi:ankyrin repeat protein